MSLNSKLYRDYKEKLEKLILGQVKERLDSLSIEKLEKLIAVVECVQRAHRAKFN